ncbi:ATPase domain-containing protein [Coralloluteibacterium stylophorae]|uniref:non-specific serine/threonine protein kinase n=1 Tax=Coralloluteibacterium stylophorae TaxID=1776034 RepID=A0A8J7VRZ6_9GAMM|nr:ATPase domain-containing protein [Coralloluteibacterium stylophorae]MBS7457319.1 AAA family ATPase [Coralloluteibacterium stylophorae]
MQAVEAGEDRVGTGVAGLDDILGGGLPRGELHLVRGDAGTGKTTLGLQFLLEGAAAGERALYLSFAQSQTGLRRIAAAHGWSLQGVEVLQLPGADAGAGRQEQTLFHTADVELREATAAVIEAVERVRPERVVIDTMTTLRLLADGGLRYRRQLLGLRGFFDARPCTVLLLDGAGQDAALDDTVYGILRLERVVPEYGNVRRRLSAVKMRGVEFHGGHHTFRIRTGGIQVYPRLKPACMDTPGNWEVRTSGVRGIDALLGGGLEHGTACLVVGPTGTGKTSVATLYAYSAARNGETAAVFCFDERRETFLMRARGLGMDLEPLLERGTLILRSVSTAEFAPGEFAQIVREAVERQRARVVMLDSLTGYFHAMPQEEALLAQMHDLLAYLGRQGVLSLLVVAQHGIAGDHMRGPLDVSYMADAVVLLRHFEADGQVRKAISVLKKRNGSHESTIRELLLSGDGVAVGEPIAGFVGLLSGNPTLRPEAR